MATVSSLSGSDSTHSADFDQLLVCRQQLSEPHRQRLEHLAWERASVPESYDIAVSEGKVIQMPCGGGVASVLEDGRFWHIAGGLLADEATKPKMAHWLAGLSEQQNKTIAVYNVNRHDAALLQDEGFIVNKFGEEPVLNPQQQTWSGRRFEWVRRQSNFCRRAGVVVEEIAAADQQAELGDTLLEIMNDDLSGRTFDKPLRLLEGQFHPHQLQRRRLFVARRADDDDIEGFLACSPLHGGRGWAFETYRKRSESTRGLTAHLFRSVCDQLKAEGVERVSLCLVPGRNVAQSAFPTDDGRLRWLLEAWYGRLGILFNAKGQDHFKSRFRPNYEDRYLCVNPGSTVFSILSFLRTSGALKANWWNLSRQAWNATIRRRRSG